MLGLKRYQTNKQALDMEQSEKIGIYSVSINLILVGIKGALGFFSGSVGLLADAIHSLTDVISSATVVAGIRLSRRKSKSFPYGLYKLENFVSLLSSIFIFVAGYEILHTVFINHQELKVERLPHALGGIIVAIGIAFAFSRYELHKGQALNSPALVADAKHIKTDMLSSIVIFGGLLSGFFGVNLDKIAAGIVALFIFKAGIEVFLNAIRVLLDASLDFETMDKIKAIIEKDPAVVSIKLLRGRNSGPFKFIEAEIIVRSRDLHKAHETSQRIENEIKSKIPHVDQVLIHYEPQEKETMIYAIPLLEDKEHVSDHFGEAPFYYVVKIRRKDGLVVEEACFKNPVGKQEKGKGIKVSKWLLEKGVDRVYSPKGLDGKGPGYVFSDAGVEVIQMHEKTLQEIMKHLGNKSETRESSDTES